MRVFSALTAGLLAASLLACNLDPDQAAAEFREQGLAAAEAGDLEVARIQLRNAVQAQPGSIESRLALADVLRRIGDHGQAVAEYRAVVDMAPDNAAAAVALGEYYVRGDAVDEAVRLADRVLKADPDNIRARLIRANAMLGRGDTEAALKAFEAILADHPEHLETLLTMGLAQQAAGDTPAARATLRKAVSSHPDSDAAHRALGEHYLIAGELESAERSLMRAFELAPLRHWESVVALYLRASRLAEAEHFLSDFLAAYPDAARARFTLVELLQRQGRAPEALAELEQFVAGHPDEVLTRLRLAELYLDNGRTDEAASVGAEALQSTDYPAEAALVRARLAAADHKIDDALTELDMALEASPGMSAAHLLKGDILASQGRLAEAEVDIRAAVRFGASPIVGRARLARLLERSNRPAEALSEADSVLERDPTHRPALETRGDALLTLGRLEEAVDVYQTLAGLKPSSAYYVFRLGTIDAAQGRPEAARLRFEEARRLAPDDDLPRQGLLRLRLEANDLEGALAEIDRLYPDPNARHKLRAEVRIVEGNLAAAEEEIRKAIEAQPDDWSAHLRLAGLRLSRQDAAGAIREVDALIAADPRSEAGYLMKAYYLERSGDIDGAIDSYERTLRLDPANLMAANNLAFLYAGRGANLGRALTLAQTARRTDPDNPEFADTLGWVLYKMGNHTLAVDQLLFAVNNGQPGPGHYYRLGAAYAAAGDRQQARRNLRRALEMSSSFPEAGQARDLLAELGG